MTGPLKVITQQGTHDCGVCALAMFLRLPYAEAMEAVTSSGTKARKGLFQTDLIRAAATRNILLKKYRRYNLEEASGILRVDNDLMSHFVVLFEGHIIDPMDGTLWDADLYLSSNNLTAQTLLMAPLTT